MTPETTLPPLDAWEIAELRQAVGTKLLTYLSQHAVGELRGAAQYEELNRLRGLAAKLTNQPVPDPIKPPRRRSK